MINQIHQKIIKISSCPSQDINNLIGTLQTKKPLSLTPFDPFDVAIGGQGVGFSFSEWVLV